MELQPFKDIFLSFHESTISETRAAGRYFNLSMSVAWVYFFCKEPYVWANFEFLVLYLAKDSLLKFNFWLKMKLNASVLLKIVGAMQVEY
jgi:hypothetical protein